MRSLRLLVLLPLAALLGGCPVWLDENEPPGPPLECRDDADCAPGALCDYGVCIVPPECTGDGDCIPSERCDAGACVPRPSCMTPADCVTGETCVPDGYCAPITPCADHADCPAGTWCGGDALCFVPPTGACRDDGDCGAGALCVQDFCRDAAEVCQFNFQCGLTATFEARSCVDNACGSNCAVDADCASSGTRCASGYCVPDHAECVTHADCAEGSTCFLGRCLVSCAGDGSCALAEDECSADGLCRPTWAPKPLCASAGDCQAGSDCVDGVCRAPCPEAPLTCLNVDVQLTHCNQATGYCETEVERTPECFAGAECGGQSCVNASCRAL